MQIRKLVEVIGPDRGVHFEHSEIRNYFASIGNFLGATVFWNRHALAVEDGIPRALYGHFLVPELFAVHLVTPILKAHAVGPKVVGNLLHTFVWIVVALD